MTPALISLAIQETPNIIEALKALFKELHPAAPEPTSADVMAAFEAAFASSVAKDDHWLSVHPE